MDDKEAMAEMEFWFNHLEEQKAKSEKIQELARLAKTEPERARRELRQIDKSPTVHDGARLYPAVRHAYNRLKKLGDTK